MDNLKIVAKTENLNYKLLKGDTINVSFEKQYYLDGEIILFDSIDVLTKKLEEDIFISTVVIYEFKNKFDLKEGYAVILGN